MAARTGTASQIDGSAASGSIAVTVPGDCDLVVAFWAQWDNNGSSTLSTLTLNGVTFLPANSELAEGAATDETGVGVAVLESPATGSQTLAWAWSAGGARAEGGEIVLVYVTGANIGDAVRAAGTDANTSFTSVAVTLSTETTDLLLAFGESFTPTNPALDATNFINNATLNSQIYDVSDITPSATSTTVNMTGEFYSCMAAISLKVAVGAIARTLFARISGPRTVKRIRTLKRTRTVGIGGSRTVKRIASRLRTIFARIAPKSSVSRTVVLWVRSIVHSVQNSSQVVRTTAYLRTIFAQISPSVISIRLANYLRTLSSLGAVQAVVAQVKGVVARTVAVAIELASSVSRAGSYLRSVVSMLAGSATVTRIANYLRTIDTRLGITAFVGGVLQAATTFTRSIVTAIANSSSVSRSVSYLRAVAVNISHSITVSRIANYLRTIISTISNSAIVGQLKGAIARTVSALVGVGSSVVRKVSYLRTVGTMIARAVYKAELLSLPDLTWYYPGDVFHFIGNSYFMVHTTFFYDTSDVPPGGYSIYFNIYTGGWVSRIGSYIRTLIAARTVRPFVAGLRNTGELVIKFVVKTANIIIFKFSGIHNLLVYKSSSTSRDVFKSKTKGTT